MGFAILLGTLSCGAYWNLKVAHYRDLLELNANAEFLNHASAVPNLDWLSLSTIESWAPFLFGLLLDRVGILAVLLTVGLNLSAFGALWLLRPGPAPRIAPAPGN